MDILGIGPLELILILILALAIFGPEKLPEIGAKLGKGMRQMRKATREFSQEIEKARQALDPDQEISGPFQEIGGAVKDATALAQATRNPGQAIRDSVMRELKAEPAAAEPPHLAAEATTVAAQPRGPATELPPGPNTDQTLDAPPTPATETPAEAEQPGTER